MENNKYDHYLVLDAARGVAALAVFIYHLKTFVFPDVRGPEFLTLSSSYLAVDLFFLMSGIVLAKAYGEKLVSGYMSFGKFMSVRFFRLYTHQTTQTKILSLQESGILVPQRTEIH